MAKVNVMVVEDETIVAKDLEHRLARLGYGIAALATSGEEAVQKAAQTHPDLVLMDIRLSGAIDGIKAAEQIQHRLDVPIIFVTAHADDETLARATAIEPYGYLIKPFVDKELQMAVSIALQQHRKKHEFIEWVAATLKSVDDAVMAVDAAGFVTMLNPIAENLTGWTSADATGMQAAKVFTVIDERPISATESPVTKALREAREAVPVDHQTILVAKDGTKRSITWSAIPIWNDHKDLFRVMMVFRDLAERKEVEETLRESERQIRAIKDQLASAIAMNHELIRKDSP